MTCAFALPPQGVGVQALLSAPSAVRFHYHGGIAAEVVVPVVVVAIPAAVAAGKEPASDVTNRPIAAAIPDVVKVGVWRWESVGIYEFFNKSN